MITANDVLQTMRAVEPLTTQEQANRYHQTIESALDTRWQELQIQAKDRYRAQHGRLPDSLTWEQMLNRIIIDAENQIRGEYLDELTAQATEQSLQDEEEQMEIDRDRLLSDPEAWKTRWAEINARYELIVLAVDLWPDEAETPETERFHLLAAAMFASMEYREVPIPMTTNDARLPQIHGEIHDALGAIAQR